MADSTSSTPNFYALLIGIDCYMPNKLPNGGSYRNLGGCVRDITHVETFLKEMWKIPEDRILKLTASTNSFNPTQPSEPPEQLPTYKNIVDKFRKLVAMANKDDQVYIHYSGHGGRAKTNYPEIKGANGIDEALVPTDIGKPDGQYLRDLELAKLLKELVDKQIFVTLVLDSCHSGGATRGDDTDIRGMDVVDTTDRPMESLVASAGELAQTWDSLTEGSTRSLSSGWLPESRDYVLLAACRPTEFAFEGVMNPETRERNGALTYWLLDSLRQLTPGLTYKDLHDRINAKVNNQFPQQTPMLIGEGNRIVLGSDYAKIQYTVPVLKVELAGNQKRVCVEAGQVSGLRKGAEFVIYPQGVRDFTPENRLGVAKITDLEATKSWCELQLLPGVESIKEGDQAVLTSASTNLVRKVRLLSLPEAQSQEDLQANQLLERKLSPEVYNLQKNAFQNVQNALEAGKGWIELVSDEVGDNKKETAHYFVTINNNGEYEICDRAGTPYANMQPPLEVSDPNAAASVIERLVHLAKYHATEGLDNFDKSNPLMGKLTVEWIGKLQDYDPVDPISPDSDLEPLDAPDNPTVNVGEWIFLRIRNEYSTPLNVAVLSLSSDWSITQVYPENPGNRFVTIDPKQEEIISFHLSLADSYQQGKDIAKVFATVSSPNFRWLELPPLDEPIAPKGIAKGNDPLEHLFATIGDENPNERNLVPATYPSREWTTKQVKINVQRA
ncbi:hypothetical protein NUACC21_19940 [Scytonema sp. NUACC21]